MKKLLVALLILTMLVAMTACAKKNDDPTDNTTNTTASTQEATQPSQTTAPEEDVTREPESALGLLETVWTSFGDEERFFAAGGDENNAVNDAPGVVDIKNTDVLTYNLKVPQSQHANIEQAASLVHAMNGNIFSSAAFRLKEGTDVAAFTQAVRDAIVQNQWVCGFPDTLLIAVVGQQYVTMCYGQDPVDSFRTYLQHAYPTAQIVYNEAIS